MKILENEVLKQGKALKSLVLQALQDFWKITLRDFCEMLGPIADCTARKLMQGA